MRASTFVVLASGVALVSAQSSLDIIFEPGYILSTPDFYYNSTSGDNYFTTNWTRVADTCVSPQEFTTCQQKASNQQFKSCMTACPAPTEENDDGDDCRGDCHCTMYAGELNCAMEFCWNHVYGCEYQKTAMNAMTSCGMGGASSDDSSDDSSDSSDDDSGYSSYKSMFDDSGIPYYPAPLDAESSGECSCNIGRAWEAAQLEALPLEDTCNQTDSSGVPSQDCGCCSYVGAYSSFYQLCPTTSAFDVGVNLTIGYLLQNFSVSSCDAVVDSTKCVADKGFLPLPKDNSTSFYNSAELSSAHKSATGTLSNLSGQITSPISGYTLTWTANSTPYTITATSTTLKAQGSGGSSSAIGASATASASATSVSASASGSETSASKGAAVTARAELGAGVAAALGVVAMVAQL